MAGGARRAERADDQRGRLHGILFSEILEIELRKFWKSSKAVFFLPTISLVFQLAVAPIGADKRLAMSNVVRIGKDKSWKN